MGPAAIRNLVLWGPNIVPCLGFIFWVICGLSPLFDNSGRSQGWHDKAVDSLVVTDPSPHRDDPPQHLFGGEVDRDAVAGAPGDQGKSGGPGDSSRPDSGGRPLQSVPDNEDEFASPLIPREARRSS